MESSIEPAQHLRDSERDVLGGDDLRLHARDLYRVMVSELYCVSTHAALTYAVVSMHDTRTHELHMRISGSVEHVPRVLHVGVKLVADAIAGDGSSNKSNTSVDSHIAHTHDAPGSPSR